MNQQHPSGPPPHSDSVESEFLDLRHLFEVVMYHKWSILGLAFVCSLATAFWVFSIEPVYRASASIVLESQQANVVNVEDVYSVDTYDFNYSQTQYEILKSRNLAERVVRRLNLYKLTDAPVIETEEARPWYAIDLKGLLPVSYKQPPVQLSAQEQEERAIQALSGQISAGLEVSPVEYSYIVYLSYDSTDPNYAAQIVNTLAEEFINGNLANRLEGTLQATDWLGERLESLKQALRRSEKELQDFREQEGLVDIEGVTGLGGNELTALSQRLQDATKARIEAQNIKEDVQGMANASTDELMSIPAVQRHEIVSDLKRVQSAADRRAAELGKRYGVKHPKMISAQSELSTANAELAREVRKVVSGISHEFEMALRTEQQLQTNWESRKNEIQDFNRVEFRLQELQREVEANRQLYDIFFTRIKNVSETGGFAKPHARIVDRAMTPESPFKPNKRLSIMMAFLMGLVLGCVVAVALDILDNTVKSPDDVPQKLKVPLLGAIPKQKLDKSGEFEQIWQNAQSPFAEAIRTIRTGVVLSGLDDPARVIVVTSTLPGEGKSTLALNLGVALGQMEKTLVIGGDLRRPSLARMLGLASNHRGLSHFVAGNIGMADCMEYIEELQIHVMPCGIIPPNPLELISSRRFVEALTELREQFERIVIDSAPVQSVSDALILASYADSVIYVVKADSTPAKQAQKGIASIVGSNEPLTGAVLNQFDAKRAGNAYYSEYYQYSGGASAEAAAKA
jgi:polysaccharide biosynthesis transport protein